MFWKYHLNGKKCISSSRQLLDVDVFALNLGSSANNYCFMYVYLYLEDILRKRRRAGS